MDRVAFNLTDSGYKPEASRLFHQPRGQTLPKPAFILTEVSSFVRHRRRKDKARQCILAMQG